MPANNPKQLRKDARRLHAQGKQIPALEQLDQLIQLNAANADDWRLTGNILGEVREFAQAIDAYEHSLQLDPENLNVRYELGRAYYKLGNSDQAAVLIEQVAIESEMPEIWMALASIAPGVPSYSNLKVRQIRERFADSVRLAEQAVPSPTLLREIQPGARKRIGFLSAHWNQSNYMKPVWPLINAHDTSKYELFLFNDEKKDSGDWQWLTVRAQRVDVSSLSNKQLAQKISQQEIDLLIDLSSYSCPERLGVFVHRPAPIQATWFNSFATNGLDEFDYIIGDRFVLTEDEAAFYCERFLSLPVSYLTFQSSHAAPPIAPSPFESNRCFTFGSLGTQYKITQPVIDAWSTILNGAPASRLVLANRELQSTCNRKYLLGKFQSNGIDSDRITILAPAKHFEFLKYYDQIDLALDTFPYNGGTTTMESLWQGVPTLTFNGDRWASRTSRSIIRHTHIPQFDCEDCSSYVRTAIEYATDATKQRQLSDIRHSMREELSKSNACNSQLLADEMANLYETMLTQ